MAQPLTIDVARDLINESLTVVSGNAKDRIGIETEIFAMPIADAGFGERAHLGDAIKLVESTGFGTRTERGGNPMFDLGPDGEVTFEPGGQIEHATHPYHSVSDALDDVRRVRSALTSSAADLGLSIVSCGVDGWHCADDIPQFLPGARYQAMAEYFARKSDVGPHMMRNTASIQINLDGGSQVERRWRIANLISPLLTATFSTSPSPEATSQRARIWQALDPTRTGFPNPLTLEGLVDWALEADVMLRWTSDTTAEPMEPGYRMIDWINDPDAPAPATRKDLEYHLTTLFPEVRLRRGVLELRAIDALPSPLLAAPAVLVTAAIYDTVAADEIESLLMPHASNLSGLWNRAAGPGLGDPQLAELATAVWHAARAGAARMPDRIRPDHLAETDTFLERFTDRATNPAMMAYAMSPQEHVAFCAEAPSGSALRRGQ